MKTHWLILSLLFAFTVGIAIGKAQEQPQWKYAPELLRPFWLGDTVESESVLFVRAAENEAGRGALLFPVDTVLAVRSSSGEITYQEGVDYQVQAGRREIVIPSGSRIVTSLPSDLRRPTNSQPYQLTHRDGGQEIRFGAGLEYHQLQTSVSYKKANNDWPVTTASFDARALPISLGKLRNGQPLQIVLLGDSISTGCNASGWGQAAPFQPAYQDLLVQHLQAHYQSQVSLTNLSVGGMATPWGITMVGEVAKHKPDLVMIAFGMNDSAGRTAEQYGQDMTTLIAETRALLPNVEFILIASMLGNRDWTRLNHDVFPKYRNELAARCQPGIALADMTSIWDEMLRRKQDADLTGNGVNHPNDFGHRIYAQVLSALLLERP